MLTNVGEPVRQFFARLTKSKLDRVQKGLLPGISEQDCVDQQGHLCEVLWPELNDAPSAIDHGDLAAQNIIVDSAYNVTG